MSRRNPLEGRPLELHPDFRDEIVTWVCRTPAIHETLIREARSGSQLAPDAARALVWLSSRILEHPTCALSPAIAAYLRESLDSYLDGRDKTVDQALGLKGRRGRRRKGSLTYDEIIDCMVIASLVEKGVSATEAAKAVAADADPDASHENWRPYFDRYKRYLVEHDRRPPDRRPLKAEAMSVAEVLEFLRGLGV